MYKALGLILAAILGLAGFGVAQAENDNFRVTLLGTGSPDPDPNRFSASTLIEAGDQKLLIDVGRGATIRLYQLHVPLSKIDVVFFTHYHSDHTIGLPDLLLTGWLPPASFAHRTAPLHVIGPVGAKNLLSNLAVAYGADIKGREEEQHLPPEGVAATVEEFTKDGVVYDKDGIRVTAFEVDHGIKPAYGYRIDYEGRSVLLSGDTRLNENVIKYGEGVDLLIHEVFVASAGTAKITRISENPHDPHHTEPSGNRVRPHTSQACRLHAYRGPRNPDGSGTEHRGYRDGDTADLPRTVDSRRRLDDLRHRRGWRRRLSCRSLALSTLPCRLLLASSSPAM